MKDVVEMVLFSDVSRNCHCRADLLNGLQMLFEIIVLPIDVHEVNMREMFDISKVGISCPRLPPERDGAIDDEAAVRNNPNR
jgi:hypothetical protein